MKMILLIGLELPTCSIAKGAGALSNFLYVSRRSKRLNKHSIAVARTGVLHNAMGMPATRKTATEEDQGEDI